MDDKQRNKRFRAARREVVKQRTRIQRNTAGEINRLLKLSLDKVSFALATQPSDYQLWALPQLRQTIQTTLNEFASRAGAIGQAGLSDSWEAGRLLVDAPLKAGGVSLQGLAQSINPRQLVAMREFMTNRMDDISLTAINRMNSELGLVITGTQSPSEAVSNISRLLKVTSRGRAITIVRTELGRAFSSASHARKLQAREIVPGLKKQWRRSGKVHSRVGHDSIDGQIRDPDKPFTLGNGVQLMYPRDPAAPPGETINCGCESLPFMESWDVMQLGRQEFSAEELSRNIFKRNLQQELGGRATAA